MLKRLCVFVLLSFFVASEYSVALGQFGPSFPGGGGASPGAMAPGQSPGPSLGRPGAGSGFGQPSGNSSWNPTPSPRGNSFGQPVGTPGHSDFGMPHSSAMPGSRFQPHAPGFNGANVDLPHAPFGGRASSIGPIFQNPIARTQNFSHFNPTQAATSIRIPSVPGQSSLSSGLKYTPGNYDQLQQQIDAGLSQRRSLGPMWAAVNAIDELAPHAPFANKYRRDALAMTQKALSQNSTQPMLWVATAKLSAQVGDEALFKKTTAQFIEKFPGDPHAHYFVGMQALKDQNWKSAEVALKNAQALGLTDPSLAQMLKTAIDNQKWVWQYAEGIFWIMVLWFLGMLTLYLLGEILSRFTLKAIEGNQLDAEYFTTRLIRRIYRVVIILASVSYYLSLPLILLSAIMLPLAIGYAALLTPYFNLILLGGIAVGSLGGIVTAISGIRTAMVRLPKNDDGMKLKRTEAVDFWQTLESVAGDVGTRSVDEVWLVPGADLAVMEQGGWLLKARDQGKRIMIFGVALLDGMQVGALRSLLAHEFAHFRHRDTAGGDIALRVEHSMSRFANAIVSRGKIRWWDITVHFLKLFHFQFTRMTLGASRLQEVLADRAAVELYGTQPFIDGLNHVIRRSVEFDFLLSKAIDLKIKTNAPAAHLLIPRPQFKKNEVQDIETQCNEVIFRKTTLHDSHPAPANRFSLARRWNIHTETDNRLVETLFEEGGSLLHKEMSTFIGDRADQRAKGILEFNELMIKALTAEIESGAQNLRFERAGAYLEIGQFEKAIEDIDFIIKEAPSATQMRWYRAVVLRAAGRNDESIAELKLLAERSRSLSQGLQEAVYESLGYQYFERGQLQEAAEAFDRYLELAPNSYSAIAVRVAIAADLGLADQSETQKLQLKLQERWQSVDVDLEGRREGGKGASGPDLQWMVPQTLVGVAIVLVMFGTAGWFGIHSFASVVGTGTNGDLLDGQQIQELKAEQDLIASQQVEELMVDLPSSLLPATDLASSSSVPKQEESPRPEPEKINFADMNTNVTKVAKILETHLDMGRRYANIGTGLSWRVHILPDLGFADLYKEFHLDEPWDSPHNKTLLSKMPGTYKTGPESDATRIRDIPRHGTLGKYPQITRAFEVPDGAKETAILLLAGEAVPWTKPEPVELQDEEIAPAMFTSSKMETILVMMSGQVMAFPKGLHPLKLHALLTTNGNEHISSRWFEEERIADAPPKGYRVGSEIKHRVPNSMRPTSKLLEFFAVLGPKIKSLQIPVDSQLSWRVHMLPLIGEQDLYAQFRLNEPWDSDHNYPLIGKAPELFQYGARPGKTRFRAYTSVIKSLDSGSAYLNQKLAINYVSVADETTWTRPETLDRLGGIVMGLTVDGRGILADWNGGKMRAVLDLEKPNPVNGITFIDHKLLYPNERTPRPPALVEVKPKSPLQGAVTIDDPPPSVVAGVAAGGPDEQSFLYQINNSQSARISRALLQYMNSQRRFPNVQSSKSGNTLKLSWRVDLLPYLGHQELFDRFDHSQSWDSPANEPLLHEIPDVYKTIADSDSLTQYVMFIGDTMALSNENARDSLVSVEMPVTDARGSTVLGGKVGASKAVPWTKPEDLEVDPRKFLACVGDVGDEIDLLMVSRSDRLSTHFPSSVYHALLTANGHELVDSRMLDRYTAHSMGKPLVSHQQARAQESYYMSVVLSVLMNEYQQNKKIPGGGSLSWRVHILPSLDYLDLYRQFRLDEPWDSPHNKQLIPFMPDLYRDSDASAYSTTTRIVSIAGQKAVFQTGYEPLQFDAVTDKKDETILLMQAPKGSEVVWTKPDHFHFDYENPRAGLENVSPVHGLLIGLMNRHVTYLSMRIQPDELRAMVTANGGESVDVSDFFVP